jgi:hypothetical protein
VGDLRSAQIGNLGTHPLGQLDGADYLLNDFCRQVEPPQGTTEASQISHILPLDIVILTKINYLPDYRHEMYTLYMYKSDITDVPKAN